MSDTTKKTTETQAIRAWADARGGVPARVESTGQGADGGLLRIMFPTDEQSDSAGLTVIDWDDFFKTFHDEKLALLYQERAKDGSQSKFCRIVSRD